MFIIGWIFIFYAFVFLLGFVVVSPVLISAFLIRKAGFSFPAAIAFALIATALISTGATGLLQVDLWSGAIPRIIPGIFGGTIILLL